MFFDRSSRVFSKNLPFYLFKMFYRSCKVLWTASICVELRVLATDPSGWSYFIQFIKAIEGSYKIPKYMYELWNALISNNASEVWVSKGKKRQGHMTGFSKINTRYTYFNNLRDLNILLTMAYLSERDCNPSAPDAPNWRISVFEKRLHETETSLNVMDSVKRSGVFLS